MKNRMYDFVRPDGKCIILAFDHGGLGVTNFDDPRPILEAATSNGVDAVLSTWGVIKRFRSSMGKVGVMLRIDNTVSAQAGYEEHPGTVIDIKKALPLGIDGVMCMGVTKHYIDGKNVEGESLEVLSQTVQTCDELGLVSAVEMLPNFFSPDPADSDEQSMKIACHVASEVGVDLIKTRYTQDHFENVVKNSYAPIVALGGPYVPDTRSTLKYVRDAMDAGCIGIAMGRNIHGRPLAEIPSFVKALDLLVHQDASVDEAMAVLDF
jgi:class I fructose-bisphosphate aldolase